MVEETNLCLRKMASPSSKMPPPQTPFHRPDANDQSGVKGRTGHRTVPMRFLVVGLSRTGTFSLRQALLQLGYGEIYHGFAFGTEDFAGAALWRDAARAKYEGGPPWEKEDWDRLFGPFTVCLECVFALPIRM